MARGKFLTSDSTGFVFPSSLGNARKNFDVVHEMIGGNDRMADWADKNPTEFYKLYSKNIVKEVEASHTISESLEQKLARLEAGDKALNVTNYSLDGVPMGRETVAVEDGDDE